MSDLVSIISSFFVTKAKKKDKKKLLEEAMLVGASLGLLALLKAHKKAVQDLAKQLFNEDISAGQFRSQFRQLLKDNADNAYLAGSGAPLTDADKKFVKAWVDEQYSHVDSFIQDAKNGTPVAPAISRAVLWAAALGGLGSMALMHSNPNIMGTWHYGDTLKHCNSCANLNGKTLPLGEFLKNGWIPQQPGSHTLDCGGWRCGCTIKDSTGKILLPIHLRE